MILYNAVAAGVTGLEAFIAACPAWVMTGFGAAGGMMTAVGFGILLSMIWDTKICVFYFVGFICAKSLGLSSLGIAVIGAAIALRRQVLYYDRYVKSGAYAASPVQYHFGRTTHRLYGSRWGIVGLGAIGRAVARAAEALGCEVRYASTSGAVREEPYPALALDELLAWADVVSVHCPLNDRTRNLIGAAELARMRSSALLINVARGGIVDEAALAAALDAGRIAGAALDVFAEEPVRADNPLLHLADPDRMLLSPHNAWSPVESVETLVECIARNIATLRA